MIIRGTAIPLGKLNKAEHVWGIPNSPTEINRILKQAPGKPINICKECFTNANGAHGCDLDSRSTVGTIISATYDRKNNSIRYDAKFTDPVIESKVKSGEIYNKTSPRFTSEYQDDNGFLNMVNFEGLTLVKNPSFGECTFETVYIGEATNEVANEVTNEVAIEVTNEDEKKSPLDVNKPKPEEKVMMSKKDFDALMQRITDVETKVIPKEEPKKKETEQMNPDETKRPEGQFLTQEQLDAILAERQLDAEKTFALQQYQTTALGIGIEVADETINSMKLLPLDQIKELTENYKKMGVKIPVQEKKTNKPTYYNKENGTGGFDGSNQFTVGYPDDDGKWSTKY